MVLRLGWGLVEWGGWAGEWGELGVQGDGEWIGGVVVEGDGGGGLHGRSSVSRGASNAGGV